jgi:CheY-like chemotaxis protein
VTIHRKPPRAPALWHQTTRTALVVDDEQLVRTFVSTVLRRRGWSVIEAPDGPSALAMAPERLDLLVTDYEMPSVSGLALAQKLRLRIRGLPVVMVSGHPEVAGLMDPLHGSRTAFVSKPFPVEKLISTIGSVTR